MYEVLALSALHLSIQHPSKSELYRTESNILQARSLSLFNSTTLVVNEENVVPAFLFSCVLGLHCFCDTFLAPGPDLNLFLGRLIQSIQLLRGVRTLVGNSWGIIRSSDIKGLISADDELVVDLDDDVTHAYENLRSKFSESHTISAFDSKVYCDAITRLIWVYNRPVLNNQCFGPLSSRMITAWPITIAAEYTNLLEGRKPEALVVMAYFSILLHTRREFWAVGDAGEVLLTAIADYLGEEWAEWLVVPKEMVLSVIV
jgi:hypothetical protein